MLCVYCERRIVAYGKCCRYCCSPCHERCIDKHEKEECRPKWDKDHITDFVKEELK